MNSPIGEILVTLVVAALSGTTGWVLRDLRQRTQKLEVKVSAAVVALFYIIIHDPNVPLEAKVAIQKAMET